MANSPSPDEYPYEPDQFDREAETASFHGAHRAEESFWRQNAVYLAIIGAALLVLLILLIVVGAMGRGPKPEDATPSASAPASSAPAETSSAPSDGGGDQAEVDKSTPVLVVNVSGKGGLAGAWRDELKDDGWTKVQIQTSKNRQDKAVVYYREDKDEATARELAKKAGVEDVQQSDDYDAAITFLAVDQPKD